MNTKHIDIAAICETWWNDSSASICDVVGFTVYCKNRKDRKGGGVALFIRDTIVCRQRFDCNMNCECVFADVYLSNNHHILIGSCYVPPNRESDITFLC